MPRRLLTLCVLLLTVGILQAQTPADSPSSIPTAKQDPPEITDLKDLEKRWCDAMIKGDVQAIKDMLDEDFVLTDSEGKVSDRKAFLATVKTENANAYTIVLEDLKVHLHGTTAVVTGSETLRSHEDDSKLIYRFTDTFIKSGGKWRCVASHLTQLEEKPEAQ